MNKAKTVKEVLTAARWIIDNVGWCQKDFYQTKDGKTTNRHDPNIGSACALGSIFLVEDDMDNAGSLLQDKAVTSLLNVIDVPIVAEWNDDPTRTKAQVLAAFDKAIEAENE